MSITVVAATKAQWTHLRLPSFGPWVGIKSTTSMLFQFIFELWFEKHGIGQFFFKKNQSKHVLRIIQTINRFVGWWPETKRNYKGKRSRYCFLTGRKWSKREAGNDWKIITLISKRQNAFLHSVNLFPVSSISSVRETSSMRATYLSNVTIPFCFGSAIFIKMSRSCSVLN